MKQHSSEPARRAQRREVWVTMPCPYCQAPAGEHCRGVRGQVRYASHQERWDLLRERTKAKELH